MYFDLTKIDEGFRYEKRFDIIDAEAERAGYFLLFSTDMESDVEDLLYYYRAKDVDEKMFYQLKVQIEGNRLRVHNDKTLSGKMFVVFIALIIRSYLLNNLSDYLSKEHITLKKAILRLPSLTVLN
jgi:transposase